MRRQWRIWSGRFAASAYAAHIDIEVNAIRNAAALIDVSPLFTYRVSGSGAERLVDRVITRDASAVVPGRVIYTPWCDTGGRIIDDGTLHRLDDGAWRWTAGEGQLRWLRLNARGLDVSIEDQTDTLAALALQGPLARDVLEAAAQTSLADLRYYRRRALRIGGLRVDVSRTGYTGDLGYELWVAAEDAVALWDALVEAGAAYTLRPVGILALDVARIEAGLIMAEVDYTSAWHAQTPTQTWSPFELGLGRLVALDKTVPFVGQRALRDEAGRGGPPRQLVGLVLDWDELERLYAHHGLAPAMPAQAWRDEIPVYAAGRQVGRATSGAWSALLKQNLALATVEATLASSGTHLEMEWSVEGERDRIGATVTALPFFDPPRLFLFGSPELAVGGVDLAQASRHAGSCRPSSGPGRSSGPCCCTRIVRSGRPAAGSSTGRGAQVPGQLAQVVQLVDRVGERHAFDVHPLDVGGRVDGAGAHEVRDDRRCSRSGFCQRSSPSRHVNSTHRPLLPGGVVVVQERLRRGDAREDLVAAEVGPLVVELSGAFRPRRCRRSSTGTRGRRPRCRGELVQRRDRRGPDEIVAGRSAPSPVVTAVMRGPSVSTPVIASPSRMRPPIGEDLRASRSEKPADAVRRVEEHRLHRLWHQRVLQQAPQVVGLRTLVDDGAIHAGPRPVAVELRRRVERGTCGCRARRRCRTACVRTC